MNDATGHNSVGDLFRDIVDDEDLKSGVDRFINEWLGNTIKRALDGKLKIGRLTRRIPASQEQHLRVEAPEDQVDDAKLREFTERSSLVG